MGKLVAVMAGAAIGMMLIADASAQDKKAAKRPSGATRSQCEKLVSEKYPRGTLWGDQRSTKVNLCVDSGGKNF